MCLSYVRQYLDQVNEKFRAYDGSWLEWRQIMGMAERHRGFCNLTALFLWELLIQAVWKRGMTFQAQ